MIYLNSRILKKRTTGVQRYLNTILDSCDYRLKSQMQMASSTVFTDGILGHLWEQSYLPVLAKGQLLWSPSNSGPILHRNQVVTIHDLVPIDCPEFLSRKFSIFYQHMLPKLICNCRKIIAISEFTKSRILHLNSKIEDKIEVIHNGVDPMFRPCDLDSSIFVLNKYNLISKRYILSVSSLEPRKNLNRLVEAWRRVKSLLDDDVYLVVVGAGGDEKVFGKFSITEDNARDDRLRFLDYVPDEYLPVIYSNAIATYYLSTYEGFGLPPLESMACGTPVVVANNSAPSEVVGKGGVLISPFSLDEISQSIIDVVETNKAALLRDYCLDAASNFSSEKMVSKTQNLLLGLV